MFKRLFYNLGYSFRETGQALDRIGCRLQGDYVFKEELSRHRRISPLFDKKPSVGDDVFIAPSAAVMGNVSLGKGSAVWYGAVLRGDVHRIVIGEKTTVGNRAVIHVTNTGAPGPTTIGNNVLIGDGALVHACTLQDGCEIKAGAIVLDGAVVESNAIVGPGAVVTPGKTVAAGQYWEGNPAKFVREVTEQEREQILDQVDKLYERAKEHEKQTRMSAKELHEQELKRTTFRTVHPLTKVDPALHGLS